MERAQMAAHAGINWTNESVKALAKDADPVQAVQDEARNLVLKAKEKGWSGPPFNPIFLAEMMDVRIQANASISDARLFETDRGAVIEFNPKQPRQRVRFSIAHEIAHLLFPDWAEQLRNRGGSGDSKDEWQLEMLCNLVASELVLPIGSLSDFSASAPIEKLMQARLDYDVSVEAFLIRIAKVSEQPVGVFVSSPRSSSDGSREYAVDYYVGSPTAPQMTLQGLSIPESSIVRKITAIGHTDFATENWITDAPVQIECVGIPGFPGSAYPRVAGLARFDHTEPDRRLIKFVHGNVLQPKDDGPRIICQLVNDRATKWGGGVARKFARKYPEAEAEFSKAILELRPAERLGAVLFSRVDEDTQIASIVAQEGFGPSLFPRIRYSGLVRGLEQVAQRAIEANASIHMPRLGTGAAGGEWDTIQELIESAMVRAGLKVTIYDLPPKREQLELFE